MFEPVDDLCVANHALGSAPTDRWPQIVLAPRRLGEGFVVPHLDLDSCWFDSDGRHFVNAVSRMVLIDGVADNSMKGVAHYWQPEARFGRLVA